MAAAKPKTACLQDEIMLQFHEGRLTPEQKLQVVSHTIECEPCAVRCADIRFWDGVSRGYTDEGPEDIGAE